MNGNNLALKGIEIASSLVKGLRSQEFIPVVYPVLFEKGIESGSFHPYMVSSLLLLGDRLGFSPICDSPIFDRINLLLIDEGRKRPDSVWFERGSSIVRVLIEFERFTTTSLENKAQNLIMMADGNKDAIQLIVLIYWSNDIRPLSDLQKSISIFRNGFHRNGAKFNPPTCPVLILETKTGVDELVKIEGFIVRQLIVDGENKPQKVDELNA
jgi:hypothetical protein